MDLNPEAMGPLLLNVMQQRQLIPFMDIAYQGFGENLAEDAYAIRQT